MGSTINGDGTFRVIHDLSYPRRNKKIPSVNSFVKKKHFKTTWDDFKKVVRFFKKNPGKWLLAIFDWEKAYRQLPTDPDQWPYLILKDFEDGLWVDTRVAFGGVAGCGIFGRPADAWKELIEVQLAIPKIFRWVDDNMLLKRPESTVTMRQVVNVSNQLGVKTNHTKYHEFDEEQKYLGFIWNGTKHTVRLPAEKLNERREATTKMLRTEEKITYKTFEQLVGQLCHLILILPHMKPYMRSMHHYKKSWGNQWIKKHLSDEVKDDLEHWEHTLNTFDNLRILPDRSPIEVNWYGDASTSFGLGLKVGSSWAMFWLMDGWESYNLKPDETPRKIAWAETIIIRLGIIMVAKKYETKGKRFIVHTDNTTTEGVVRNRKSKDKSVNEEWKRIQNLLTEYQCDIKETRVTSEDNPADALSRGDNSEEDLNKQLYVPIPSDLYGLVYQEYGRYGKRPRQT